MTSSEDKFRELQQKVESVRAEAEQAKGAIRQIKSDLKKEFKCSTFKEAKQKLKAMTESLVAEDDKLQQMIRDYEAKWNGPKTGTTKRR